MSCTAQLVDGEGREENHPTVSVHHVHLMFMGSKTISGKHFNGLNGSIYLAMHELIDLCKFSHQKDFLKLIHGESMKWAFGSN